MPSDPISDAWRRGFDAAMGFQLVTASADEVVLEYRVEERHRQIGRAHV